MKMTLTTTARDGADTLGMRPSLQNTMRNGIVGGITIGITDTTTAAGATKPHLQPTPNL